MAEEKHEDQNGAQDDGVFDYDDLIKGLSGDEESGDEGGGTEEEIKIDDIAIDEIIGDDVEETRAETTAGVPGLEVDGNVDLSSMFDELDDKARGNVVEEVEPEPQPMAQVLEDVLPEEDDELPVFDKSIEIDEEDIGGADYAAMLSQFGGAPEIKKEVAVPQAVDLGVIELADDEESAYATVDNARNAYTLDEEEDTVFALDEEEDAAITVDTAGDDTGEEDEPEPVSVVDEGLSIDDSEAEVPEEPEPVSVLDEGQNIDELEAEVLEEPEPVSVLDEGLNIDDPEAEVPKELEPVLDVEDLSLDAETDDLDLDIEGEEELAIETVENTGTFDAIKDEEPEGAGDDYTLESSEDDAEVTDEGGQTGEILLEEESETDEQEGFSFDADDAGDEDKTPSLDDLFGDDEEESSGMSLEGFGGHDEEEVEEVSVASAQTDDDEVGGDFLGLGDLSGGQSSTDKFAGTTEVYYDGVEMEFDDQISAVTLAEVYLAQGKPENATEIYTTVAENKGITGWVARRLRELGLISSAQPEAPAVEEEQQPEQTE